MMNDCRNGDMRDLLPGYVHGTLPQADRLAVAAHLASCVDCAAEAALIEAASRAFPTPAIDIEKIVRSLPSARGYSRHGWFTAGAWRAAAAIGLIALGAYSVVVVRGRSGATSPQTASASAPAPGSTVVAGSSNARTALDSPARALPSAVSSGSRAPGISFGGGLSDLTDEQLDTLLGELDALDSLPSAEPESHLTPIVPMADGGHNAR
jgi:anti-sigma factor RsiW